MSQSETPSKSAVRKAGSRIRGFMTEPAAVPGAPDSLQQFLEDLALVDEYRRSFARPMASINASLRSFVSTCGIDAKVTQRLKRMATIVDKISFREAKTDLSRMRDLGGCRVVTASEDLVDLYALRDHAVRKWGYAIVQEIDYVKNPRQSGYRAIHLIVKRRGKLIEVQLRTARMHEWAITMEAFSSLFEENFKQDGVTVVHEFMDMWRRRHEMDEIGEEPTWEFLVEFRELSARVRELMKSLAGGGEDGAH